jgi:Lar family restriction alleviation protein
VGDKSMSGDLAVLPGDVLPLATDAIRAAAVPLHSALKPCPFCGGTAAHVLESDHSWPWVECPHCSCCSALAQTVELAIEKWNRRA